MQSEVRLNEATFPFTRDKVNNVAQYEDTISSTKYVKGIKRNYSQFRSYIKMSNWPLW